SSRASCLAPPRPRLSSHPACALQSARWRPPAAFFFYMYRPPPPSPLFPYTTLFRSRRSDGRHVAGQFARRSVDRGSAAMLQIDRSEEHTSELQSLTNLVCRLLLEKKRRAAPLNGGHGNSHSTRIVHHRFVELLALDH